MVIEGQTGALDRSIYMLDLSMWDWGEVSPTQTLFSGRDNLAELYISSPQANGD